MEKKDFKEINITEVAKKAGVSRMAFYRNYAIMEDIITTYLDELFKDFSEQILYSNDGYTKESVRLFFSCFRKQERLLSNLNRSNLSHLILERCIDLFYTISRNLTCKDPCSPIEQKYRIEFAAGGLYKVLIEWAKTGMAESDEEMAFVFYRLMRE